MRLRAQTATTRSPAPETWNPEPPDPSSVVAQTPNIGDGACSAAAHHDDEAAGQVEKTRPMKGRVG